MVPAPVPPSLRLKVTAPTVGTAADASEMESPRATFLMPAPAVALVAVAWVAAPGVCTTVHDVGYLTSTRSSPSVVRDNGSV